MYSMVVTGERNRPLGVRSRRRKGKRWHVAKEAYVFRCNLSSRAIHIRRDFVRSIARQAFRRYRFLVKSGPCFEYLLVRIKELERRHSRFDRVCLFLAIVTFLKEVLDTNRDTGRSPAGCEAR